MGIRKKGGEEFNVISPSLKYVLSFISAVWTPHKLLLVWNHSYVDHWLYGSLYDEIFTARPSGHSQRQIESDSPYSMMGIKQLPSLSIKSFMVVIFMNLINNDVDKVGWC